MYRLSIAAEYGSPEEAMTVYSAVSPDDDSYVSYLEGCTAPMRDENQLEGCTVRFDITADDAGSMRSAMDDVMSCLKVAEAASGIVSGSAADFDGDSLGE